MITRAAETSIREMRDLIKKDLNLESKTTDGAKRTMTKYALYPVTF